jgi:regulator of nucleoside diphosphate kinase
MNTDAKRVVVVACAAASFAALLSALPLAEQGASPLWVITLWCSALLACALLSTGTSLFSSLARRPAHFDRGAYAAWACAAPLALLADGAAQLPISILIVAAFFVGAASILGAPMYVPEIIVTKLDVERITRLLDVLPPTQHSTAHAIEVELARASVVASTAVPRDVVTMNSRVVFEHEEGGKQVEAVLVYPHDSDSSGTTISILAPVGTALLGLREGQCIDWRMPTGRCKRIRVLNVVYQPEAAGDFHL